MNKSNSLTMYCPLSPSELKNTIGGNRSNFWDFLLPRIQGKK